MFQSLSDKLTGIFDRLKRRGVLRPEDIEGALREVRIALLEADVALPVVKKFIDFVSARAVGVELLQSVAPGQQVIKIVHDALVDMLRGGDASGDAEKLNLNVAPPAVILMAGLQGSGKTTTSGKLAKMMREKMRKRVLLASLDIYRPAAQLQLEILAGQAGVSSLPIVAGEKPMSIAMRAMKMARTESFDVLILDSAGRLQIDAELMDELKQVQAATSPVETLLVADALTGQESVNIARGFQSAVGITGIILTRMDGDGRGGAALSMRSETGRPIKFIGVGEKLDGLAEFDAERIAGRILGMGDVVGLVERAMVDFDAAKAEKMAAKMQSGKFDLNDMLDQFRQLQKMGGMAAMMDMLPGMGKIKQQMAGKVDENVMKRQEAMILSMTPAERRDPDLIKASRKKRIAAGSGMRVEDVNKLLKSYEEMSKVMKQMKKIGIKGMLGGLMGKGGMEQMLGGINPADIFPKDSAIGGGKNPANNLPPGLGLPPGFKLPKF